MSRYPDNPYWCQKHDRPLQLWRNDWDQAVDEGHLTVEHVLQRFLNIAAYEFGNGADMGFDEAGFRIALTADGMRLEHGISLHVYPNDHPPPHVHVRVRSDPSLKPRVNLESGQLMDPVPPGMSKKVRQIRSYVRDHHNQLAAWWAKHHGNGVVVGAT